MDFVNQYTKYLYLQYLMTIHNDDEVDYDEDDDAIDREEEEEDDEVLLLTHHKSFYL